MATQALVPVEEYLSTMYHPDCDYVDGEVLERNMGDREHAKLQTAFAGWFYQRRKQMGIHVMTELRIKVRQKRYRLPDVCVFVGPEPEEDIPSIPPFLCVEILSPDDRMQRLFPRIHDFLDMGVEYIWVIDPPTRNAWIWHGTEERAVTDGILRTANPDIALPIAELFD